VHLTRPATWNDFPANLWLNVLQYESPRVFESDPYSLVINGSLSTLNYKIACYGAVALLCLVGVFRNRWLALGVMVAVTLFHGLWPRLTALGLPMPAVLAM